MHWGVESKKAYKISDFEGPYIQVTPSGSKLWNVKYRLDGKERKLSLGAYPASSLAQARQDKEKARALIAQGVDPEDAKQNAKRERREVSARPFKKIGQAFLDKQRKEGKSPDPRYTKSLHKIIIALVCDCYGYEANSRKGKVIKDIQNALAELSVELSDDTIRGILKKSEKRIPNTKDE